MFWKMYNHSDRILCDWNCKKFGPFRVRFNFSFLSERWGLIGANVCIVRPKVQSNPFARFLAPRFLRKQTAPVNV